MLPDGTVSHEFPCNFSPTNPYCQGIQGIMEAYYNSLRQVRLYGPTNFSPVISHVAKFASAIRDGSHYFVLLIITDGVITDMPHTIKAIVDASSLPMSIIIVGVGNDSFEAMEVLDADNQRLNSGGKFAERDIVQFVPLRNYLNGGRMGNAQASLAKEVLAEVPTQFLSYMQKHGVKPKPPRTGIQHPSTRPLIQGQATGGVSPRPPPPQQQWAGAPQQQQYGGTLPPGQATSGMPSHPPPPQQQWAGAPQQQQYGGTLPPGQATGGMPSHPPPPQQQWAGAPQQQQYGGTLPPGQATGGMPSHPPPPQQQWAGVPQQQQYGGTLPPGQATGGMPSHPPPPQQQWAGAPQQQQYGGTLPPGQATGGMPSQPPPPQQQWAGAPPPSQQQWGGAPPSYQPQWGGTPQQGTAPNQASRATAPPPP
ncbi:hypothetical protein CHS0354_021734 [Potamilus streckersoni]|uniref:Copine C-terminal domain-containing protein n=1 Tax=Potamilus streckersoni TaxID=2493646 RepID=A0AAE0TKG7_9BIVA|nr:hypothetical protein CHS0354_021734 [Potamilus streckersoni]